MVRISVILQKVDFIIHNGMRNENTHTHTQFGYVLLGGKCVHLLAWVVTNLKKYIYVHVRTLTTCTFNNSTAIFALMTYVSGMQALNFNLDDCKCTIRDLGIYPYASM